MTHGSNMQGKVAIVTAGARGIGAAAVRRLVAEGVKVAVLDVSEAALAELSADLTTNDVLTLVVDVADGGAVRTAVDRTAEAFGGVDFLFSNAGVAGAVGPVKDADPAEFDRIFAVNVRGVFNTMQAVVPQMEKRGGGSIVVTASVAGVRPTVGLGAYSASKSAVIGLARVAALELGPLGIRVNAVAPGHTDTEGFRESVKPVGKAETNIFATRVRPLGRLGQPDDLANAVFWLFSDEASYVTGALLNVDGGLYG